MDRRKNGVSHVSWICLCGCETGASRTETSQRDHKGDTEASDSGRFARQFCVVHAQECAKLLFQHIIARGTTYMEERDPPEGSLGMGHFLRFTVVLRTF